MHTDHGVEMIFLNTKPQNLNTGFPAAADHFLRPDGLRASCLYLADDIGRKFNDTPRQEPQFALEGRRGGACFRKDKRLESRQPEKLPERGGGKNRHVGQIAVNDPAGKKPLTVARLEDPSTAFFE